MKTAPPVFQDFDLHFGQRRQTGYPVSVQWSPAGETSEPVDVDGGLDNPYFDRWLSDGGGPGLRQEDLIAWGKQLTNYLLPEGEIRDLYQRSWGMAVAQGARLRLRLRIAAPELAAMPWEYAYDSSAQEFIALSNQTALVRYPSQPVPPRTVTSALPLPILVLAANPIQQPALAGANEVVTLAEALTPLLSTGDVTIDVLFSGPESDRDIIIAGLDKWPDARLLDGPASLDTLRGALRRGYRVIHFIGHAMFDRSMGGVLLLVDASGAEKLISAEALARELRDTTAAVVVLNACQSAVEGTERTFVGLAPRLIQAGVPAVVAMQHMVADADAQVFSQAFYRAIADGWPLDAAMTDGRKAMSTRQTDSAAWGIPVLFMRSRDGLLWVEPTRVRADEVESSLQRLADQAAAAALAADQTRAAERRRLAEGVNRFAERLRALAGAAQDQRHPGPYRGLLEFRLSDAEIFSGRDQAVADLLAGLQRSPLLVLHAESGAGKTSLIHAGLEPRLLTDGSLPVYLRPYDEDPASALRRIFLPQPEGTPGLAAAPLRQLLEEVCQVLGPEAHLVVFLDQFEEFFTQLDEPSRLAFIDELADCLETTTLPVNWVLALRSEYLSHVASFHPRIRRPIENNYRLNRLTRLEAGEAIISPAQRFGISYEAGLVDRLLDDLGKDELPPPQTQLVCQALFEGLGRGETVISGALYDRLGDATGILREHLERVLKRDLPSGQEEIARFLLKALLNSEGQRVLRTQDELAAELAIRGVAPAVVAEVMAQLVDSRLLRAERTSRPDAATAYELAHDYLANQLWLSPEERARKAAQELLERELSNWRLYGAPMRPKSLEVIGAVRDGLSIDATAAELLVRSALDTGVDLPGWLAFVSPDLARAALLGGLEQPEPAVRASAARHLAGYASSEAVARLVECASGDADAEVRAAALASLQAVAPAAARQVLLSELDSSNAVRRSQAARLLVAHLDQEVAGRLFAVATADADEDVWRSALQTLAADQAAHFQAGWRPLLKAHRTRQAAAYRALRQWRAPVPLGFAMRTGPARTVDAMRREAKTRPARLAVSAGLAAGLLYLLVAVVLGLPPIWSNPGWQRVAGAPEGSIMALTAAQGRLYLGSHDWGVARRDTDGQWRYWLADGLPTVEEGMGRNRRTYVKAIYSLAADPQRAALVYALIPDAGVYRSMDDGETWEEIGATAIPTVSQTSEIAVWNGVVLVADDKGGVFGSSDAGETWRQFDQGDGLPAEGFEVARFDQAGTPYVGGRNGLYRGGGAYPWTWEAVVGVPRVFALDIGADGRFYLITGRTRGRTALCREPDGRILVGRTFNDRVIISVAAAPGAPDAMVVGTLRGAILLECSQRGNLGLADLIGLVGKSRYASKMISFQDTDGKTVLLQVTQEGLLERKP